MEKVQAFLNKYHILKNELIVVACSGGPDSMYLLDTLNRLGYKIICAHVNHNVRKESFNEYEFLNNYCKEHKIIFEGMTIKKYNKDNFHHEARKIRYEYFLKIVKKYKAKYLATAHHGDDLMETILMRLNRGSSLIGYAGFKSYVKNSDYILIRPLIKFTKDELQNLVEKNNIPYVIDQSNNSNKYTRNRFRHHILPILKEENKNVHLKYLDFSEEISELSEYFEKIILEKKDNIYQQNVLNLTLFQKEPAIIKKAILRDILLDIYKDDINLVRNKNITEIISIIDSDKPNIISVLPKSITMQKCYDKLIFNVKNDDYNAYNLKLDKNLTLPNGNKLEFLTEDIENNSNFIIRLNSNEIVLPLIVRSKHQGDKMIIKNMKNYKKIKEIFIEEKIPQNERINWPIVTDSANQIIWLPGLKKSNFDVKKTNKYDIIIKYHLKGEKKSE